MIKEICQFVETLEEQTPDLFEEGAKIKEGIYVALDIGLNNEQYELRNVDENGDFQKEDIGLFTKKEEMTPFFERCRMVLQASKPVDKNKIFNPNLKIFNVTCSPFAVGFTKDGIVKNLGKVRKDKTIVGKEGIINELTKQYFKKAEEFIEDELSHALFYAFKNYLTENFWNLLDRIKFNELKGAYVIVFFMKAPSLDEFKKPYSKYVAQNVFNKAEYNVTYQNSVFGISDSLNTFNDKKRFLQHQSASFKYNFRIQGEEAQLIWKFYQLQQNNQLPKPLPIFVSKEEAKLNATVVKLFNSDGAVGYSEIIRSLFNIQQTNLQNFYLLFVQKKQIIDFDFVPVFKYTLKDKENKDFEIKELFGIESEVYFNSKKDNIFDFQYNIVNKIFNGQLVQKTNTGLWIKYFDDLEIKPDYGLTGVIYNLLHKYRRAWYDFIYKSKFQGITMSMIDEMIMDSVSDDLRRDEGYNKTSQIQKKLSIWFGLQFLFDTHFKINSMANKTVELQQRLWNVIQTESLHIESDDEFAFAAGQVIWKLFMQSKSSNRSHALLEPFLQKTDPVLFKQAIANTFNMYKHDFVLYPTKYGFDKLMSEVMGFIPSNANMKEHMPMILAGYFSESLLKKEQ